jgi:hypothetical protein
VPHHDAYPRGLERFFGRLLPRYADIGEEPVIKFEKLPALVTSFTPHGNPGNP